MAVWNPRANEIFASVLELPSAQRQASLEQACGADSELRRQVEALLAAHAQAGSFLDQPAPGARDMPTAAHDSGPPLPAGGSVVQALAASRVHLRDPADEALTPVSRLGSDNLPEGLDPAGRLLLQGEIARGGMGAILKGRDVDLGRDLAVKVLLETHQGKTELARRFVEEAQIAGQLQHPGIVPVYELGLFPDRRPYFTMKLVKGKTLAALLAERKNVGQVSNLPGTETASWKLAPQELPKFLGIFEQVCQTLAYAHARGVIHRDLKPSNVMVGAFGEVQVMDWGLAKVLAEGGVADEKRSLQHQEVSVVRTQRSRGSGSSEEFGSHTQAGSVLGTPAYMAPEQARGDVDLVDEHADVFGLGAILCEILTGKPPFTGKTGEAQRKAQTAQVGDAHARLDGCGADAELIALAKRCLAAEPWDRPRQAGEVAAAVTAYQQSVAERLRQAEVAGAEAKAREEEERKRRKLTLALTASVLLTALLGGGGWVWIAQQQAAREREALAREVETTRQIHDALAQAKALREQARLANDDPSRWAEARAMAKRAEALLETDPANPELVGQVRALVGELNDEENDRKLVARLDEIRLAKSEVDIRASAFAEKRALPEYARAFAEFGLNVSELSVGEAAWRVGQRPPKVREALVAALDDWLDLARRYKAPEADRLARLVDAADHDPWRKDLRQALARDDQATLDRLAGAEEFSRQRPQTVLLLAHFYERKLPQRAVELLRAAHQRYPADFWINYRLAGALYDHAMWTYADPTAYDEVLRFDTAALALRPDNPRVLGQLGRDLNARGRTDEALPIIRRVLELAPDMARGYHHLAGTFAANTTALLVIQLTAVVCCNFLLPG